jgi:hypothetical protein
MKEFFKNILSNFAQKLTMLIVGGMITVTVALFTDVRQSISHHFSIGKELQTVERQIIEINEKLDSPTVQPDTALYSLMQQMNETLYKIQISQRVSNAKLDVLKESSEVLKQRFDDIERVSATQEYNYTPKITIHRINE